MARSATILLAQVLMLQLFPTSALAASSREMSAADTRTTYEHLKKEIAARTFVPDVTPPAGIRCQNTSQPLSQLICSNDDLSKMHFHYTQAYEALRQQLSNDSDPKSVDDEDKTTEHLAETQCGIAEAGDYPDLTPELARCLHDIYDAQRARWVSEMNSAAKQEATRSIADHLAIEGLFTDPDDETNRSYRELSTGVYDTAVRTAIVKWQQAHNKTGTGLLSDEEVQLLEAEEIKKDPMFKEALLPDRLSDLFLSTCQDPSDFIGDTTGNGLHVTLEWKLAEVAVEISYTSRLLAAYYPKELWEPILKLSESNLVKSSRKIRAGGWITDPDKGSGITGTTLDIIAKELNKYRNGHPDPHLPVVHAGADGCGADEAVVKITTKPQASRIQYINQIFYDLCGIQKIDPESARCDYWTDINNTSDGEAMSGRYKVKITWKDGSISYRTLNVDDFTTFPANFPIEK